MVEQTRRKNLKEKGLFIVLEGSDGSGKGTQFNLIKERLKAVGYDVAVFDFPRYDKASSYFVKNYLNGEYGRAAEINPYIASLFYALDRFEASKDINKALADGKIVLANRYAGSNMAHQGGKIKDTVEQRSFFVWADNLEFQLLGIPRPDVNLYLRVPAEIAYELIAKKNARNYTKKIRDEHEQDLQHLKASVATYDLMCQLFPKDFRAIECTKNGRLLNIPQINDIIWRTLKPVLPAHKQHASRSVVVTLGKTEKKPYQDSFQADEFEQAYKDVSLLLRLDLQRSPHSRLEPSFSNWEQSNYGFYTPAGLPKDLIDKYKSTVRQISVYHKQMIERLDSYSKKEVLQGRPQPPTKELLLPMMPLCALTSFNLRVKKDDVSAICARLLADESAELQWAAKQLYLSARQQWQHDFDAPLESPEGPVSLNNIIAKLTEERLPQVFSADESIKLVEHRPKLEFDLLAESIYPYSTLSLDEIAEEVSSWPYVQKFNSLKEAAAQPDGLKNVHYKLDILSDQITLNQVAEHLPPSEIKVQQFTPRYGYDIPEIIELAGADAIYEACFDEALKLYSLLQGAGRKDSAAYATLLGHRQRWQINISGEQLKELMQTADFRQTKLADALSEKIGEIHPLLWEIISGSPTKNAPPRNGKQRIKPLHRHPTKQNKNRKKR
jgi:dTMP kinase